MSESWKALVIIPREGRHWSSSVENALYSSPGKSKGFQRGLSPAFGQHHRHAMRVPLCLSAPLVHVSFYSTVGSLLIAGKMASKGPKPTSPWLMYRGRHTYPVPQTQTRISWEGFSWLYWVTRLDRHRMPGNDETVGPSKVTCPFLKK